SRRGQVQERLATLKGRDAPFNVIAMLAHHLALLDAELNWMTTFIEEWEAQAPPDTPPAPPPESDEIPRMKQVILPHDPDSLHRAPTRPLSSVSPPEPDRGDQAPAAEPSEAQFPTLDPASQTTIISAATPPQMTRATIADDALPDEGINQKIHEDDPAPPSDTAE
ncbi:MAG: hypothetical protein JXA10_12665, partial [Anaerolineae bacterium]|nr:hypothetical protein [Anaerolineae bacterium]